MLQGTAQVSGGRTEIPVGAMLNPAGFTESTAQQPFTFYEHRDMHASAWLTSGSRGWLPMCQLPMWLYGLRNATRILWLDSNVGGTLEMFASIQDNTWPQLFIFWKRARHGNLWLC